MIVLSGGLPQGHSQSLKDPEVAEFLDDAMKKKNLEIVSAAYAYYIKKGEAGTEDVLIEALQEGCYEKKMVFDFAYCGNEKLKQAADEIAKKGDIQWLQIGQDPNGERLIDGVSIHRRQHL